MEQEKKKIKSFTDLSSNKEKTKFFYTSLASLTEVQNQLLIAKDLSYLEKDSFDQIATQTIVVNKLVSGLIKSAKILNTRYKIHDT